MRTSALIRLLTVTGLSASTFLCAQSRPGIPFALPPTAPTQTPAAPLTPAQAPPHRAEVSYANYQITVSASNSSLNQILHDISRLTGMKITGGVVDERVFGSYGPAYPEEILGTLLNGTASNMLFVQATDEKPSELILTTRTGGPTPPNPNATAFNDSRDDEDEPPRRPSNPPRESQSYPAPPNPTPQPITPPPADNNNTGGASPSSDSNQQQSPNGVKTPQQIYEELQRLRQQQQQQKSQ